MEEPSRIKTLLRHIKHWLVVKTAPRKNRVYTQFYRFPNQYRALIERIVPRIRAQRDGPLQILVFGCCSGAEPISLASVLKKQFPDLDFQIRAYDIVPEVIERAQSPLYSEEEVFQGPFVTDTFVAETFEKTDEGYRVRPELMSHMTFAVGDMLDRVFIEGLGKVDLVFAQNVLFHLAPASARRAFANLNLTLRPGSALFINGMDVDMRVKLTKKFYLDPLEYLIEEIHNDARVDRGNSWAAAYWGRKPFSRRSREWIREHCTIYSKARV